MAASFLEGMIGGVADAKEKKTSEAERKRQLDIAEQMANRPVWGGADQAVAMNAGSGGGGAHSSATSYTYDGKIGDRAGYAYNYFVKNGVPPAAAAGLVGNMMQESGTDINPAAVGDSGNAFGAAQWNGPRKRAYLGFAAARGTSPTDYDTQLDFLLHEGRTSEKGAWGGILDARTPREAAVYASDNFWRPGLPHNDRRAAYAEKVYNTYYKPQPTEKWPWFQNYSGGQQP
jgi:hypothetical protein